MCLLVLFSLWGTLNAGEWDYFFSSNVVTALCPVDDAYWIGTTTGLLKMDPASGKLTHYHMGNSALPSNKVMSVVEGWDGRIWVGTYDGLASFDGESWEQWTREKLGIKVEYRDIVSSMLSDHEGNIWLCLQHWEADISEDNSDTVVVRISPESVDWDYVEYDFDLIGCSQGLLIASTSYGAEQYEWAPNDKIFMFDGNKSDIIDLDLGVDSASFALHTNGDLIIKPYIQYGSEGSSQFLIHRNVAKGVSPDKVEKLAVPGRAVQSLHSDARGNVFAVIDDKLWSWSGNGWSRLPTMDGRYGNSPSYSEDLEYYSPPVIAVTANGDTLAANGSVLWNSARQKTHNLHASGLAGLSETYDMLINRDGQAWIATSGGLVSYDGAQWTLIPYPFVVSSEWDELLALALNSRGEIWLQHQDDIYQIETDDLSLVKKFSGLKEIAFDLQNNLWALSSDKLQRLRDGTWKQFAKESGLPATGLQDMYIDASGKVWILALKTIHSFNGSSWSAIKVPIEIEDGDGLCVDSKGVVRLFESGSNFEGYYWFTNGKWQYAGGFAAKTSSYIADDKGGWWCWTSFPGPGDGWAYHHNGQSINQVPGSPYGFCNGIYIDSNNNKWFILPDEIAVYNEDGIKYPSSWSKTGSVGE